MEKFVLKETLAKTDSGKKLLKINPQDVNMQKLTDRINIGSVVKLHIAEYKKKTRHKESNVPNFCKEVLVLLVTLTSNFIEKSL